MMKSQTNNQTKTIQLTHTGKQVLSGYVNYIFIE